MARFLNIVFVFAITTLFCTPSAISNKEIPSGHPRVYLTKNDLNEVRKKIETLSFMKTWEEIKKIEHPFVRAFEGLVMMNQQMMEEAAKDFLPLLKGCTDARQPFNEVQLGSCIYDWCYYEMNDSLKLAYINEFKRIVGSHSPFFPARKGSNVIVGHSCEAWIMSNQLPAGLAIYDEDPVMYDSAAAVFFEEIVPVRNFVYQSHMNHQGDSYSAVRLQHDLFAAWLYKKMGKDVFSDNLQFVPYQLIYNYRPDGQQIRSGDTFDDAGNGLGGRAKSINQKSLVFGLCGSLYHDPYQLDILNQFKENDFQKVFDLIFMPLDYQTRPISNLPLTKFFPHPMGEMIARTGWEMGVESPDAVVQMRIGNFYFGNHQHKDFGTFQIYYKGPLAISSGIYQGNGENYGGPHWTNYLQQTISKNGLLVFNPDETTSRTSVNDGGQHWPKNGSVAFNLESLLDENNGYKMGEVTAYDFGPDMVQPSYSYIAGDITAAYHPGKVDRVARSMLTINTGDPDFPALFFVFDHIRSDRDEYKKTWLLHAIQEPEITGKVFTITRTGTDYKAEGTYNGKLVCRTILPQNATITKVGGTGREFWVEASQTNYYVEKDNPASEPGAWRIEVSPTIAQEDDLFFHAMAITQADNKRICAFEPFNAGTYKAVKTNKYLVMFNSCAKGSTDVQFTLDEDLRGVFVNGLCPGNWKILRNGSLAMKRKVADSAQCIYFEGLESGAYHLTKIN